MSGPVALPIWERRGECAGPSCAACCKFVVLQVHSAYLTDPDVRNWLELHGITLAPTVIGDAAFAMARIPLACGALAPDGRCELYGRPERPKMCAEYPVSPLDLLGVEGCSYEFIKGGGT